MLCSARLLDIAHPAMHLDAGRGDRYSEIGTPRLEHRDQQVRPALRRSARARIGMAATSVDHRRSVIGEDAHRPVAARIHSPDTSLAR